MKNVTETLDDADHEALTKIKEEFGVTWRDLLKIALKLNKKGLEAMFK